MPRGRSLRGAPPSLHRCRGPGVRSAPVRRCLGPFHRTPGRPRHSLRPVRSRANLLLLRACRQRKGCRRSPGSWSLSSPGNRDRHCRRGFGSRGSPTLQQRRRPGRARQCRCAVAGSRWLPGGIARIDHWVPQYRPPAGGRRARSVLADRHRRPKCRDIPRSRRGLRSAPCRACYGPWWAAAEEPRRRRTPSPPPCAEEGQPRDRSGGLRGCGHGRDRLRGRRVLLNRIDAGGSLIWNGRGRGRLYRVDRRRRRRGLRRGWRRRRRHRRRGSLRHRRDLLGDRRNALADHKGAGHQ